MTLEQACKTIEDKINLEHKNGCNHYRLSFDSQPNEQEDGTYREWFRADLLYMITGDFEYTISEALIALAKRIEAK